MINICILVLDLEIRTIMVIRFHGLQTYDTLRLLTQTRVTLYQLIEPHRRKVVDNELLCEPYDNEFMGYPLVWEGLFECAFCLYDDLVWFDVDAN